jgi:hypothetical protein
MFTYLDKQTDTHTKSELSKKMKKNEEWKLHGRKLLSFL